MSEILSHVVPEEKEQPTLMSTNQVRQILFNELGLSREFVRDLIKEVVEKTIEKYFKSGHFEKYLKDAIDKELRTYHYGRDELKALVGSAVADSIKKEVTSKLTLHVSGKIE